MCRSARSRAAVLTRGGRVDAAQVIQADALACPLPDRSCDAVVSSFGLKTFSPEQQRQLAAETCRLLRPGGVFAFLEISVPRSLVLRPPYLFYLSRVIPALGRMLLGNPECYRMLGVYTRAFGDASGFARACADVGLDATLRRHFFGCATSVSGRKPATPAD
jgi:demethylmenaquinone methyltransferase/2-methoxy-6-polyprenyl-1,4-benzoquinol methylase